MQTDMAPCSILGWAILSRFAFCSLLGWAIKYFGDCRLCIGSGAVKEVEVEIQGG